VEDEGNGERRDESEREGMKARRRMEDRREEK
jgi:hypothetical protein